MKVLSREEEAALCREYKALLASERKHFIAGHTEARKKVQARLMELDKIGAANEKFIYRYANSFTPPLSYRQAREALESQGASA